MTYDWRPKDYSGSGSAAIDYDNTKGGSSLLDIKASFTDTQGALAEQAKNAQEDLSKDPSDLNAVAAFQAANASLMNMFGAQSNILKSVADKINELNRNIAG